MKKSLLALAVLAEMLQQLALLLQIVGLLAHADTSSAEAGSASSRRNLFNA